VLGELYEPVRDGLSGEERFRVANYRQPCVGHSHESTWHHDIDTMYGGRRPILLGGDPARSYGWSRPTIRLYEPEERLPRNPRSSDTLESFLQRLRAER
jgi:hypothetical protein